MRGYDWLLGLALLGGGWPGLVVGQDVDMEEVRRRAEKYERDFSSEASKPAPTVDYDHEAWKAAAECGTATCFRAYLEDYPTGRYAKMARARLESEAEPTLRPVVVTPPAKPAQPTPKPQTNNLEISMYKCYRDGMTFYRTQPCPNSTTMEEMSETENDMYKCIKSGMFFYRTKPCNE